jgi:hypothetical protein
MEGGACSMYRLAVELDHEAVLRPDEVAFEAE